MHVSVHTHTYIHGITLPKFTSQTNRDCLKMNKTRLIMNIHTIKVAYNVKTNHLGLICRYTSKSIVLLRVFTLQYIKFIIIVVVSINLTVLRLH